MVLWYYYLFLDFFIDTRKVQITDYQEIDKIAEKIISEKNYFNLILVKKEDALDLF